MPQDLVSIELTDAQIADAQAGLTQAETALADLIALPPDESRGFTFMGTRSEPFCRQTLRVLGQNPQIVPPSLNLAGAQADLDALDKLRPLQERLRKLLTRVDDTLMALGSDVMATALEGYGQLRLSGDAYGLDDLRREVGARFNPRRRPPGGA